MRNVRGWGGQHRVSRASGLIKEEQTVNSCVCGKVRNTVLSLDPFSALDCEAAVLHSIQENRNTLLHLITLN